MRKSGELREYDAVYVDDLAFVVRYPSRFVNEYDNSYKYELKGNGSISFHLGCKFSRDEYGTLCMTPGKYFWKIIDGYKNMFNEKSPSNFKSPLEKGDYLELDNTKILDPPGVQKF